MKIIRPLLTVVMILSMGAIVLPGEAQDTPEAPQSGNADLASDLAVGIPFEDHLFMEASPVNNAGMIQVFFGQYPGGITETGEQSLHQDLSDANPEAGGAEDDDNFGRALAAGDFDCDGIWDLAVGVPGESLPGANQAGAVHILYGKSNGLGLSYPGRDDQVWHQDNTLASEAAENYDGYGSTLVSGDFDGNGCDDLAIGTPYEDFGTISTAGEVSVLYGSASGLSTTGEDLFFQGPTSLNNETAEGDEYFGDALAAGDFNGDGRDDLAIGASGENFETPDPDILSAGVVHVLYGSASGLTTTFDQLFYQGAAGVMGTAAYRDRFGASLAAGDFNQDGYDELAVGVPGEGLGVDYSSGAVQYFFGSEAGLTTDDRLLTQDTLFLDSYFDDQFGSSLASGDFNGDGHIDLAAGAITNDYLHVGIQCGSVTVIYGFDYGLTSAGVTEFWQGEDGLVGDCENEDQFSAALAAGDFNADGYMDLAVGVPGEDIGPEASKTLDVGVVIVIYGSRDGLTTAHNRWLGQESADTWGDPNEGDAFGSALASVPRLVRLNYLPLTLK